MDIADPGLQREVTRMLMPQRNCQCLMMKAPVRKTNRSYQVMIFFLTLYTLAYVLQVAVVFPRIHFNLMLANIIFTVLTLFFFGLASFINPGRLRNENIDFLKLLEKFDATNLCPDCCTIRTSRSRHCTICGQCVERFDHHCPWINNCVGIKNHSYFLSYVSFQLIALILTLICATSATIAFAHNETPKAGIELVKVQDTWVYVVCVSFVFVLGGSFVAPLCLLVGV